MSVKSWTFLTNHGQVLLAIATAPDSTERQIALRVGITERAVQRIIADLEAEGYLHRVREGRRNHYSLQPELPLRHQLSRHIPIGELLAALGQPPATGAGSSAGSLPSAPAPAGAAAATAGDRLNS